MSRQGRAAAIAALRADGVNEAAVGAFARFYGQLESGATGEIRKDDIDPLTEPVRWADLPQDPAAARTALAATAVLRLNGGLGTSMGLSRAKSLLVVRDGLSFLDLIARQVLAARKRYGVRLPLVFLDSFATGADTRAALAAYPDLPVPGLPLDIVQSREPKLTADSLAPVAWPADPRLEWCPPGHGDAYPTLVASGLLTALREAGFRYLFAANADNLGAVPDGRLAAWFAGSGASYAAEVTRRTAMDRKGGHLARRRGDGRLILRDTAQTAPEELAHFMDADRHPYAHCNNLWFDLDALAAALASHDGVLPLPLIRNAKTVDPRDDSSPPVIQVESAIGAAVEVFEHAAAVAVPRTRFVPVKTTNELLVLRSDAYAVGPDYRLTPVAVPPEARLDPAYYRRIDQLEQRFPAGAPSLRGCTRLEVAGDWTFGAGVTCLQDVRLRDEGAARQIPDGTTLSGREGA